VLNEVEVEVESSSFQGYSQREKKEKVLLSLAFEALL
jgi:hypothetical protein